MKLNDCIEKLKNLKEKKYRNSSKDLNNVEQLKIDKGKGLVKYYYNI